LQIHNNIALNSSYNERDLRQICRENENTFYVAKLFPENCDIYVDTCGGPRQATDGNEIGACALRAG